MPSKRGRVQQPETQTRQSKKKKRRKFGVGTAIFSILIPFIVVLIAPILSLENSDWGLISFMPPLVFLGLNFGLLLFAAVLRHKLWLISVAATLAMFFFGSGFVVPGAPNLSSPDFRVVTLNVLGGAAEVKELAKYIKDNSIDAVFLQESQLVHGDYSDQLLKLLPEWSAVSESETAVVSRLPIEEFKKIRTKWVYPRHIISVKVQTPHGPLRLVCTHLTIPVFRGNPTQILERLSDQHDNRLNALNLGLKEVSNYNYPVIYAGDFNTPPLHGIYGKISEKMTNTFVQSGAGWGFTFRKDIPLTRIDHIWVTKGLESTSTKVISGFGSDHMGLVSELRFKDSKLGQ